MLDVADKISSVVAAIVAIAALVVAMRQGNRYARQTATNPAVGVIEGTQKGEIPGQHWAETTASPLTSKRLAGIQILGSWIILTFMLYSAIIGSYPEFQVLAYWNVTPQPAIYDFIFSGSLFILAGCTFIVFVYREFAESIELDFLYWKPTIVDWIPLVLSQGMFQFVLGAFIIPAIAYIGWAGRPPVKGKALTVAALTLTTGLAAFLAFQEFKPLLENKVRLGEGVCLDVSEHGSEPKPAPCSDPRSDRITAIIYPWDGAPRCSKEEVIFHIRDYRCWFVFHDLNDNHSHAYNSNPSHATKGTRNLRFAVQGITSTTNSRTGGFR